MDQKLRELIKVVVLKNEELYSLKCTVTAVNGEFCDVQPLNDDAELLGVHLLSEDTITGFLIKPVVGSIVTISFFDKDNAFVSQYGEIDTIDLRGNEFGGLIKIEELKTQLAIVTDRLDTIYDALNNATAAAGSSDGGTALIASIKETLAKQKEVEDYSDIENENVNHG